MRASAKVLIQMGVLTIPNVGMSPVIQSGERVSFNQLHAECKCRIQQKLVCPECKANPIKDSKGNITGYKTITIVDKNVELLKGYPITKDNYVTLTDAEIDSCKKESTGIIKIIQFVDDGEIPEIFYDIPSYLYCEKEGQDTFALFYCLLVETGKVALAKGVMRQKDHFYAIKPYDGVLVAYDLYFPSEVRSTAEVPKPKDVEFDKETLDLAKGLVAKMTKPFDTSAIKDEYTESLRSIIQAKAEGRVVEVAEVRPAPKKISLKDALRESLKDAVNF